MLSTCDIDQEVALGPDDLMPDVVKRLDLLLDDHRDVPVYGVGLSLPGTVDRDRGCSRDSPILRGWDGVDLRPYFVELQRLSGVPVILDNDANAIALAERGGDRQRYDDVLVLKVSTGLGAGIIAGGVLQRGAAQAAGEFGHNKTLRRKDFRAVAVTPVAWRRSRAAGRWCTRCSSRGAPSGTCATSSSSPTAVTRKRAA